MKKPLILKIQKKKKNNNQSKSNIFADPIADNNTNIYSFIRNNNNLEDSNNQNNLIKADTTLCSLNEFNKNDSINNNSKFQKFRFKWKFFSKNGRKSNREVDKKLIEQKNNNNFSKLRIILLII